MTPRLRHFASSLAIALAMAWWSAPATAQAAPETTALLKRTVDAIAAQHPQHLLTAPLQGCVLLPEACSQFESCLRSSLGGRPDGPQFIEPERFAAALRYREFLAIDAYLEEAVLAAGSNVDADVVVTENVMWNRKRYELLVGVFVAGGPGGKKPARFSAPIATGRPGPTGQPILLKDPDTGAALIVWNGDSPKAPLFQYPRCNTCPEPYYPLRARIGKKEGTVALLATINESGKAEDIAVTRTFDDDATASALQAVRLWDFKPATGTDGKPFKVRLPIEVNFRLG